MDGETAKASIQAALEDEDGGSFADMMVNPTPEQREALLALEGNIEAVGEDLEYLVWESTGQWPEEGATWGDVAHVLIAYIGHAQGEIQQGAQYIAQMRAQGRPPRG